MDIKEIIASMSLQEKADLCTGKDFWKTRDYEKYGIPSIMLTDGPHGLRKQEAKTDHLGMFESVASTCFPSSVGLASTWNRDLVREVGSALGKEAQAEGVSVLLGPGVNIKRSPLCGRNFEYFSEDPYLTAEMAIQHIVGVQKEGVGTSLKHFAVNNQENRRMTINAIVDERTLHEIYLAGFESVVKQAKPWTVMSSYNQINGEYASEKKELLTDILRDKWGFAGMVVSDWSGVNDRVASIRAGLDLEMPTSSGVGTEKIIAAIEDGVMSVEELDIAVERILLMIQKAVKNKQVDASYCKESHHQLAKKVAVESSVLLKNKDQILPLQKKGRIAIIGEFAQKPRFQGGGSSHVNPTKVENTYDEMKNIAPDAHLTFNQGYDLNTDEVDETLLGAAKQAAEKADVAVLFVGLPDRYETEGLDRKHLRMPKSHETLIETIAQVQKNIVVVLGNGSPIEMPWINSVKAVLEGYLGGQALGGALAELLFGLENPSGKLAETFPERLEDNPSFGNYPGENDMVHYGEGISVGYRYYDLKKVKPLFPFGYGLSYTTFAYSDLQISKNSMKDYEVVDVHVTVENTGDVWGKEIVQLYVQDVESTVNQPEKALKHFAKVSLKPGEKQRITFTLDRQAFAYYDIHVKDWHVESGDFNILIGRSSENIVLKETIYVESTSNFVKRVDRNTVLNDVMQNKLAAPIVKKVLEDIIESSTKVESGSMEAQYFMSMLLHMPMRAIPYFQGNTIDERLINHIIDQLNTAFREQQFKIV